MKGRSKGAVPKPAKNKLTNGVLRVGDGRGFVVKAKHAVFDGIERLVITAAHCLTVPLDSDYSSTPEPPCLPAAHPARHAAEATYARLLGPLGGECAVAAECLFVDPISDIAVLGAPDNQTFFEQSDAYDALVDVLTPLRIAEPMTIKTEVVRRAKLAMGKDGALRATKQTVAMKRQVPGAGTVQVLSLDGKRWIKIEATRYGWLGVPNLDSGMSGSPILDLAGNAIGVVSTDTANAILAEHLPAGLVRRIQSRQRTRRREA